MENYPICSEGTCAESSNGANSNRHSPVGPQESTQKVAVYSPLDFYKNRAPLNHVGLLSIFKILDFRIDLFVWVTNLRFPIENTKNSYERLQSRI